MSDNQQLVGSTNLGKTNIYDDLNIDNERTTIQSGQLNIKDNIITINSGETSNKVTSNIAGLEIDRGTSSKYQIIYNEEDSKLKIGLESNLENVATESYVNSHIKDSFFELDSEGNYMPTENPIFSPNFELDENGDIMIKE